MRDHVGQGIDNSQRCEKDLEQLIRILRAYLNSLHVPGRAFGADCCKRRSLTITEWRLTQPDLQRETTSAPEGADVGDTVTARSGSCAWESVGLSMSLACSDTHRTIIYR
jgi:hypothetical protein